MRDDAVLGRALPLDRGLGPIFVTDDMLKQLCIIKQIKIKICKKVKYGQIVHEFLVSHLCK